MEDMTYSDYWKEVASLAEQIAAEVRERKEWDDPYSVVSETIDGHSWVIYTARNFDVLRFSSNDGAMIESYGADGVITVDGQLNWAALAYCALEADVLEAMPEGWDTEPEDGDESEAF